jgi:CBS domain-containing protein
MANQQNSGRGNQKVRDFMTRDPECVSEKDSIRDVARIMKDQDTGVVPVVDGKKVIGLVTDRDIVVRGIAEGKDVSNSKVSDLMTRDVRSVNEDTTVGEVLELMSNTQVRRVPVVNQSQELVGIVSIGDIASESGQRGKVGDALEEISEAPPNN